LPAHVAEPSNIVKLSPQVAQYVAPEQSAAARQVRNGFTPAALGCIHAALPVAASSQQSWFGQPCVCGWPAVSAYEMSPFTQDAAGLADPLEPPAPPPAPPTPPPPRQPGCDVLPPHGPSGFQGKPPDVLG